MIINTANLDLFPEVHSYISNCLLNISTWMSDTYLPCNMSKTSSWCQASETCLFQSLGSYVMAFLSFQLVGSKLWALTLTPLFLYTLHPVCWHSPLALPSDYICISQAAPPGLLPGPGRYDLTQGYARPPAPTLALSLHSLHLSRVFLLKQLLPVTAIRTYLAVCHLTRNRPPRLTVASTPPWPLYFLGLLPFRSHSPPSRWPPCCSSDTRAPLPSQRPCRCCPHCLEGLPLMDARLTPCA